MKSDEEIQAALRTVMDAGYDVMLPGKLDELRAMANLAQNQMPDRSPHEN